MVNGISSNTALYSAENTQAAAIQSTQTAAPVQKSTQTSSAAADTVQLSAAAQAHAMQQQGMAVKAIAANMGITTQDVDSYLGISSTAIAGGGGGLSELQSIAAKVHVNAVPPAAGTAGS